MRKKLLTSLVALNMAATAQAAAPSLEQMWEIVQQQKAEIAALKAQLEKTDQRVQETEIKTEATIAAVENGTVNPSIAKLASWAERTTLGGYAEHHFNHKEDSNDQIDAHRWVLFLGHQFNDKLRMFSEFELEHSLAGDGKPGEVELEQAYIELDFAENHSVQIGQFLVPVGILNETHEPDTFFGTERNKVESEIIPSTWWETGIMVHGEIAEGLTYNAAVHSGLAVPSDKLRIRSGRQKSAEANAEDLAFTGRLKYTAIPGLELATTLQHQQDITQGDAGFTEGADATLFEAHASYQSDSFGLRALYAQWDIDGDDFEAADADDLKGWFIEPSYKINEKLGFFVRYSEYERGDKPDTDFDTWDYGLNYWLHPRVVLKADYSDSVGDAESDAFNLGVGWSF